MAATRPLSDLEVRVVVFAGLFLAIAGIGQLAFADGSLDRFLGGCLLLVGLLAVLPQLIAAAVARQRG